MKLVSTALAALLVLAPATQISAQNISHSGLHNEAHQTMISAMDSIIGDINDSDDGLIIIRRFICPHVIMVLAGVGSGAVSPDQGARLVAHAIMVDEAEMLQSTLVRGGGTFIDFAKGTGATVQIKMAKGVSKDAMIGMLKNGMETMR